MLGFEHIMYCIVLLYYFMSTWVSVCVFGFQNKGYRAMDKKNHKCITCSINMIYGPSTVYKESCSNFRVSTHSSLLLAALGISRHSLRKYPHIHLTCGSNILVYKETSSDFRVSTCSPPISDVPSAARKLDIRRCPLVPVIFETGTK
jgi:hypothetical protein